MKKTLKPLIITLCVLIVLGAAYGILTLIPEPEPDVSPTPEPTPAPWRGPLVEHDSDLLARLTVTHPGEGRWVIAPDRDAGTVTTVFHVVGGDEFRYSRPAIHAVVNRSVRGLTAERLVNYEGALADFGFGPDQVTLQVVLSNGVNYSIEIGHLTPAGNQRYVKLGGGGDIYIADNHIVASLLVTETSIRDLELLPNMPMVESIARYAVFGNNRRGYDIRRFPRDEVNAEERAFASVFKVIEPVRADIGEERFTELIFERIEHGIGAFEVAANHPSDWAYYGLDEDNATTVILETIGGQIRTVHFGRATPEGYTYARFGDEPSVLKVASEPIDFIQLGYQEMISPFVWLYNITDVSRAEIRFDGRRHVFDITRPDPEKVFHEGELDGIHLNDTNASQLYMRMMDLRIREELPPDVKASIGVPDISIELTFHNGTRRRLTMFTINDRQVAVGIDGEYHFYIAIDSVTRLTNAIDTLLGGGNLVRY
jgi:hypothetical protein